MHVFQSERQRNFVIGALRDKYYDDLARSNSAYSEALTPFHMVSFYNNNQGI